jgi:hypothetical protein
LWAGRYAEELQEQMRLKQAAKEATKREQQAYDAKLERDAAMVVATHLAHGGGGDPPRPRTALMPDAKSAATAAQCVIVSVGLFAGLGFLTFFMLGLQMASRARVRMPPSLPMHKVGLLCLVNSQLNGR